MARSGAAGMLTSIPCSVDGAITLLRGGSNGEKLLQKWTQVDLLRRVVHFIEATLYAYSG